MAKAMILGHGGLGLPRRTNQYRKAGGGACRPIRADPETHFRDWLRTRRVSVLRDWPGTRGGEPGSTEYSFYSTKIVSYTDR